MSLGISSAQFLLIYIDFNWLNHHMLLSVILPWLVLGSYLMSHNLIYFLLYFFVCIHSLNATCIDFLCSFWQPNPPSNSSLIVLYDISCPPLTLSFLNANLPYAFVITLNTSLFWRQCFTIFSQQPSFMPWSTTSI